MKSFAVPILFVVTLTFFQCKQSPSGKGNIISEDRPAPAFKSVLIEGAGTIVIINGPQNKVMVKGYENLVPLVKTSVANDKLTVSMKEDFALTNSNITITISTPLLTEASLEGAGSMEIKSFNGQRLNITLAGAGNVRFSESAFDTVIAELSGAGNMYLNINHYLDATLNGVGTIEYVGDPEVKSTVNGLGKVVKK